MSNSTISLTGLDEVARHLRRDLQQKKHLLIFGHNGVGKTRLSMSFKDAGKVDGNRDTLYFNAFTEDLFNWDNDLDNNERRILKLNKDSKFFDGLRDQVVTEEKIRLLLERYAEFDFRIDYEKGTVCFDREIKEGDKSYRIENIKISRGEENIFIWCFFLTIARLAVEEQEAYNWVKYLYIDDPISSLDDNNAVVVAGHLAQLLKDKNNKVKTVISSHHTLFFNVMWNELKKGEKSKSYFFNKDLGPERYLLDPTDAKPLFHHVALLKQLHEATISGNLYTWHFNILRTILEKTAVFLGFKHFSSCIQENQDDREGIIHARIVNILNHGNYSLFESREMMEENKRAFTRILKSFISRYNFNPELFQDEIKGEKHQ